MAQSTEILPNGLQLLQDDRFFKLGQDSVLLSAFAKPRRNAKLLDLGCGTGALALLVWRPDLKITGLELQDGPLDLFRQSIAANNLENVTALQGDLRQMRTLLPHGSMDYVICNPPYFDRNAGANAPTAEKRTARQDATCSVEELAVAASFVLHTGGKAAFVFRPERLWVLLEALSRVRLVPKRMRFVHQSVQTAPSVVMVECRKGGSAEGLVSGLEEETYDVDDVMFLISDKVPEVENKLRSNLSEEGIEKKKIFFQLFDLLSNLLPETEVKFVDGKKIIVWINYVCCDGCQQNGFMISPAAVGAGICLKHFMDQIY